MVNSFFLCFFKFLLMSCLPPPPPPLASFSHISFIFQVADYDGRRALHIAACEGHLCLIQYLLRVGAIVSIAVDRFNGNPVKDARLNGHEEIAVILENALQSQSESQINPSSPFSTTSDSSNSSSNSNSSNSNSNNNMISPSPRLFSPPQSPKRRFSQVKFFSLLWTMLFLLLIEL